MRPRLLSVTLALAALAWPAAAYERIEITPGDRLLVSIDQVTGTHEYTLRMPRDAQFRVKVKRLKRSKVLPARGLLTEGYETLPLTPFGRSGGHSAPLPYSGTYRMILQGADDTVGDLQAATQMRPLGKARLKVRADDEERPTDLLFGALPGAELSYTLKWKGEQPVRVAQVLGPDDGELVPDSPPKVKKSSSRGAGFTTSKFGDHRFVLEVPEGTERWDLKVKIKTRRVAGITRDRRIEGEPVPDGLELSGTGVRLERNRPFAVFPIIRVVGEAGGANELLVATVDLLEDPGSAFAVEPRGCAISIPPAEEVPSKYFIECEDTHSCTVTGIVRDENDEIRAYVVDDIVAPGGTGRVVVSDVVYGATGSPVSWTEVRTFDGTGDAHRLVVSGAELFPNGAFTYRVEHTPPGGVPRRYDFLPFD